MKTHAAVLWGRQQDWRIEEIELDPPRAHEVLVQWAAAGLCHSDEHLRDGQMGSEAGTGEPPRSGLFPMVGGHEGGGVVLEVGPDVTSLQPGDHVAASFFPICGRCKMCITGHSNLCDLGAATFLPGQIADGTIRYHLDGRVPQCDVQAGHLRRARREPRGLAGGGRSRPAADRGGPGVVRGGDGLGFGGVPGRGHARRHRGGGRRRRRRHERRTGRQDGRGTEHRGRGPGGVQTEGGARLRRHPHGRVHGRSRAHRDRADPGPDGRCRDHGPRCDVRGPDGRRPLPDRKGRDLRRHRLSPLRPSWTPA